MKIINDIPFKSFFGNERNKEVLSILISEIIKEKYEYILKNMKYLNNELELNYLKDNKNITDILVESGKYVIDIEAYTKYSERKRTKSVVYITKILNKYYNNRNDYNSKKEIIQINIIRRKEENEEYYIKSEKKKYVKDIKIIEINVDKEETSIYTESEQKNIILWTKLLNTEVNKVKEIEKIVEEMEYSKEIKEKIKERIIDHMTKEDLQEIGTTLEDKIKLDIADARDAAIKKRKKNRNKIGQRRR